MSSMLNSISQRNRKIFPKSKETLSNEDSVINLLQSSEIEFETCPKLENKFANVNTGFGKNNDLHYKSTCGKPKLKTPLYQENFLSEFRTEEDKAAARNALGLYSKSDVLVMSLLTAENTLPTSQECANAVSKQLYLKDQFFAPVTVFSAVYDSTGTTLDVKMQDLQTKLTNQQREITKIIQKSNDTEISSLGDVREFLQGFNNGDNLHDTIQEINQDMLRFETTGQIE